MCSSSPHAMCLCFQLGLHALQRQHAHTLAATVHAAAGVSGMHEQTGRPSAECSSRQQRHSSRQANVVAKQENGVPPETGSSVCCQQKGRGSCVEFCTLTTLVCLAPTATCPNQMGCVCSASVRGRPSRPVRCTCTSDPAKNNMF